MFPRLHRALLAFPFLFSLCGCHHPEATIARAAAPQGPDPIVHNREADDTARFLAGLPGTPGSPFATLETEAAWKEHRRLLDQAWRKARQGLPGGLNQFQERELNAPAVRDLHVFYPFGGPDALTATLCFPHSDTYVLVGLEPAGTLPSLERIQKQRLVPYLAGVRRTVASELGRSFFVTREMDRQFHGQVADGLFLPIVHLLVRTDHRILGFRYVTLSDQGEVVARAPAQAAPPRFANKGVEIEFRSASDPSVHRLSYFSVNLADSRLADNAAFLAYARSLRPAVTLLKATSYMTHRADFSVVRNLVLTNSAAVLQDDSGIPYHFFRGGAWKLQLYGDYRRPYGSFRWLEQPDLRKAYESASARELPMHIGYGYRRIASNLLLAEHFADAVASATQR